jgi:hypothetical protein
MQALLYIQIYLYHLCDHQCNIYSTYLNSHASHVYSWCDPARANQNSLSFVMWRRDQTKKNAYIHLYVRMLRTDG